MVPISNSWVLRNKKYNYRKCLIVSKQVLEILFRIFDNCIWSQQSIEAFHENQRIIWTHKYSGVQTNVLRIQETKSSSGDAKIFKEYDESFRFTESKYQPHLLIL